MFNITQIYHEFLDDNNITNYLEFMYHFAINFETYIISSGNLLMIKHNNISIGDSSFLKICNSLIVNKNNIKEIVCYSGQKMKTISHDDEILLNLDLKKYTIKEIDDGEQVRLFYHDKWILSVKNIYSETCSDELEIINSFKIWFSILTDEDNFDNLNKNYVYIFRHKNNTDKNIILEDVYDKKKNFKSVRYSIKGIYRLKIIIFKSLDMLYKTFKYQHFDKAGYTLLNNETGDFIGIFNEDYIYSRYLKRLEDPVDYIITFIRLLKDNTLKDYLEFFKEKSILFNDLKQKFNSKIQYFYSSYVQTKIIKNMKRDCEYIDYERIIIDKIHNDYLRFHSRTSLSKVEQIVLTLSNQIIKTIIST